MSLAKDMNLPKGLNKQKVLQIYEQMLMVRLIDERVWAMNRQGKVPIAASCQGHEAAQLGSLAASQYLGDCFFFTYYRDLALKFGTGLNEKDIMLSYLGRNGDPYSNGRQFPLQGADLSRNVIQLSNVVAAGMPQAVGYALASKIKREPTVSLSFFGDGASSQGECHEAMNFAGIHKLPIVFVCENNHYAISVPQNLQMTVSEVSERAPGYGLSAISIDGSDFFQVYESMLEAIALARRNVPVLVEMNVERIMPHTSDDDHSRYRAQSEIANMRDRDPLTKLEQWITYHKLTNESELATITASCKQRVNLATEYAESAPEPEASSLYDNLFSK